jgi:hypothetical protein
MTTDTAQREFRIRALEISGSSVKVSLVPVMRVVSFVDIALNADEAAAIRPQLGQKVTVAFHFTGEQT